jgi:1-acyl-sn-glycerol-3-phosphate acyltransferase
VVSLLYNSTKLIFRLLFFLLTCHKVKGEENIPSRGPVMIVANHFSMADPFLLGASINLRLVFVAKEELFHYMFSKHIVHGLGAIPMRRKQMLRKSLHQAVQTLARGQALAIFPEGARSRDCQLHQALPGPALIALRSGAPVLPIGITGTEKLKSFTWFLRRPMITVNIGHPFYLTPIDSRATKKELAEHVDCIMQNIAELLPLEYRGYYSNIR